MKLKKPDEPEANVDMTPMIDCVFQLLIFFMVCATMSKVDQTPEVVLPIAPKAAIPDNPVGRGVVNIMPLGTPVGDGATSEDRPFIISGQVTDEPGLVSAITDRLKTEPNLRIYMRVDRNAEFKTVKCAIRACANAGVFDIIFGAFQSESAGGGG